MAEASGGEAGIPPGSEPGPERPGAEGAKSGIHNFAGRVAVVTGGASGIGRGIVEALLAENARVVIADIEQPVLDQTVKELQSKGDVFGMRVDVSDFDAVDALAQTVFDRYGACHLLFNNAGVTSGG